MPSPLRSIIALSVRALAWLGNQGPRAIAALVDESVDYKLKQGMPLAEAVETARDAYAELLRKKRDAVKRAHLRYGKRGVKKAPRS